MLFKTFFFVFMLHVFDFIWGVNPVENVITVQADNVNWPLGSSFECALKLLSSWLRAITDICSTAL